MGGIVRKSANDIPESDVFEVQRRVYVAKEKEFDAAILNFFHNKKKIQKERRGKYMTNEQDYEVLMKELKNEIDELENVLKSQEHSDTDKIKSQKFKILEKHKKDYEGKIKSAKELKNKELSNTAASKNKK
jgi:hypothetical protein